MKRVLVVVPLVMVVVAIGLGRPLAAQTSKDQAKAEKAKMAMQARWSGVIVRLNKDASTVAVRKDRIEKVIHFDSSTKWTKGKNVVDTSEFKEGSRVICLGKYDEKKDFIATRIDLREPHMFP
jgi:hypothetical protein